MQTENGAQRGKFGPKRDEVTGDWRKLHSEKLYNFHNFSSYSQDDQINMYDTGRAWGDKKCVQNFGWKSRRDHQKGLDIDRRTSRLLNRC
jgi:hypothetical protein